MADQILQDIKDPVPVASLRYGAGRLKFIYGQYSTGY